MKDFKRFFIAQEPVAFVNQLFLRGLGAIYFVAFLGLAFQIHGLIGSHGIFPAARFLSNVATLFHWASFLEIPTLFWISVSDTALSIAVWGGALFGVLLSLGFVPRICCIVLWLLLLSIVRVGDVFLQYQWEALLLETGFLAIFLAPMERRLTSQSRSPSSLLVFLVRWILFRLMVESAAAKWFSDDPSWRNMTALKYHYESQPIPNGLSWWMHQMPLPVHVASCLSMFFVEGFLPFFYFTTRPLRVSAAALTILFQIALILTGNFDRLFPAR